MRRRSLELLLAVVTVSAFVACGGGSVNTVPLPGSVPTTVPTTFPTTDANGQPTTAPTTVPTTIPSNTPNSTLKVVPSTLALGGVGTAFQMTLTATQTTPTQLTATGCTGVAQATIGTVGASTSITVLGTAAGSCSLIIADATGQKVVVPVTVALPALAAYCSTYSSMSGVPLNLTDDAGLSGAVLIAYITNGTQFMDNTGAFTQTTAYPLPAACFSNTVGSSATNRTLAIPNGVSGGRIYLAYATPAPNNAVPNPFGTSNISGPNVGFAANPFPWDKLEYGTTAGATIDTTQVDALGLPLELAVTGGPLPAAKSHRTAQALPAPCATNPPATIVGVTSCNFANIFLATAQNPTYSSLVVTQSFNGQLLDLQVVAPKDSVTFTSFQWNLFALAANLPAPPPSICPSGTPANGYLTCVVNAYNTTLAGGRLYQTTGIGALNVSGDNYCATSDGNTNFLFTDVGTATNCATATPKAGVNPNPFQMPIQEFTYGVPPALDGGGGCKLAILFSQPWGNAAVGAGHIFATADAFALWKGLGADINRGTTLTTSMTHPVGITSPSMGIFFQDPLFNTYAQIVHTYFNGNKAYALAYDDLGGFESGLIWQTGNPINVRINQIPTATSSSTAPVPVSNPSTCPALPINVGTF